MPNIITLTGPSGCGKSTITKMFANQTQNFTPKVLPKYTTRQHRADDDENIICVDKIPAECDIVYKQYGKEYGFSIQETFEYFKQGFTPIVVTNNIRALEEMQSFFGQDVKSYFIHREKPNLNKFIELAKQRNAFNMDDVRQRYEVAYSIYKMYIDNIRRFNSIILNTGTLEQTNLIIEQLSDKDISKRMRLEESDTNKLFIIAGNPGSGKDILIKEVEKIGVAQVPKHTSRPKNKDDGDEMICQGDKNFDLSGCDITYENYGATYGLKTEKIWDGLKERSQVVVVSNLKAINDLKEIFGNFALPIYVHSDITPEEYVKQEASKASPEYINARVKEFGEAHNLYAHNINLFNKVFIYAGNKQELISQLHDTLKLHESRNVDR